MVRTTEVGQVEQILQYLTECRSITGCPEPVALKDHCCKMMGLLRDCRSLLKVMSTRHSSARATELIQQLTRFLER